MCYWQITIFFTYIASARVVVVSTGAEHGLVYGVIATNSSRFESGFTVFLVDDGHSGLLQNCGNFCNGKQQLFHNLIAITGDQSDFSIQGSRLPDACVERASRVNLKLQNVHSIWTAMARE